MRRTGLALLLSASALLLVGGGCDEVIEIDMRFERTFFASALRADLNPVTPAQQSATALSYSNGAGGTLVSALRPRGPDGDRLAQLRTSDVLWTATGNMTLAWEVMFDELLLNGERPRQTNGAYSLQVATNAPRVKKGAWSARGATVPFSRQYLVVDEDLVLVADAFEDGFHGPGAMAGITVIATECSGGAAASDPASPAVALTEGCTAADLAGCTGVSPLSMPPWTTIDCDRSYARDTSITLDVATRPGLAPLSGSATSVPARLTPHVKKVDAGRKLVRPLVLESQRCLMRGDDGSGVDCDAEHLTVLQQARACRGFGQALAPDAWCGSGIAHLPGSASDKAFSSIQSEWTFTTPRLPDGRLLENFAPGVAIERIKVFSVDGQGARRDLQAIEVRRIRFDTVVASGSQGGRCRLPQNASGVAHFSLSRGDCDFQGDVTPAWAEGLLDLSVGMDALLQWKVGLVVRASDGVVLGEIIHGPNVTEAIVGDGVLERDLPVRPGDALFIEFELTDA